MICNSRKPVCITALLLAVCIVLPLFAPMEADASVPARKMMRIGLSYGSSALSYANLENYDNSGYDFGYYDSNLNFTKVAETSVKKISVLVDLNLQYSTAGGGSGSYFTSGSPSGIYIGMAHRNMGTYGDYNKALSASGGGFVRYNAGLGSYTALNGNYTSGAAAGGSADTGTARTITVAASGTNNILFEFDNSADTSLIFGIRPKGAQTWHKGYRYNGGFRFERRTSSALTVVNIIDLENYVKGVVPYEMSASWPLEALKAQAICARTYILANLGKHSSNGFDLCNTADCQVYRGKNSANDTSDRAVNETSGKVVTYNGKLISTLYSSSHGGGSENNENVWAGSAQPYLRGVNDDYELTYASIISNYNWTLKLSQSDITNNVKKKYPSASTIVSLQVSEYSPTGNAVSVTATDSNGKSYKFSYRSELLTLLGGSDNMRSQRFNIGDVQWGTGSPVYVMYEDNKSEPVKTGLFSMLRGDRSKTAATGKVSAIDGSGNLVEITAGSGKVSSGTVTGPSDGFFVIKGSGWGHGVGMSQWGARAQAAAGRSAEQIIRHYYTGVAIVGS